MPILHLTQKQLRDVTELMDAGLADMDAQEKEGNLEADGYSSEDLAERQRVKDAAVPIKAIFRAAELRAVESNKQALKDTSHASALLAFATLSAFGAEIGGLADEPLMESTVLRDLLTDLFHLTAAHDIDLDDELEKARRHWEAEVSDA